MQAELLDRLEIRELVENWVVWRDAGDWERFRTVWFPDGRMMATWTQGTGDEFIEMNKKGWDKGGSLILHALGGQSIDLSGNRAISQTKMVINQRATVHDVLVDVTCTGRFYDFLEKREGRWGFVLRQPIYEKDRMDAVDPAAALKLDQELLSTFPEGYRHLAYLQTQIGFAVKADMPMLKGETVNKLYQSGAAWLAGKPLDRVIGQPLNAVSVVNSWNEWDPLREVIVGSVRGAADMGYEPALSIYHPPGGGGRQFCGAPVHPAVIDDAERQLDGLAKRLDGLGVTVRRPDPVDHVQAMRTPDWSLEVGRVNACPRDVLLVVGDEIIEASMAQRARSFEFRGYRSLIKDYFRRGARWTAAPRPLMSKALYAADAESSSFDFNAAPSLTEFEPVFDAACFARCGRDLFWQPDLVSNQFGADWLARHLGPGIRIHRLEFRERTPMHIDTTLVPIRPGLVLTNPARPVLNDGLKLFRDNGWRVVEAPPSVRSGVAAPGGVSNWISMNLLMLDPHTALVEAAETPIMDLLRTLGCEVIPCPFDRVYPFGGGLHCCTTDICRDGGLESYFPTLD